MCEDCLKAFETFDKELIKSLEANRVEIQKFCVKMTTIFKTQMVETHDDTVTDDELAVPVMIALLAYYFGHMRPSPNEYVMTNHMISEMFKVGAVMKYIHSNTH